VPDKEKENVTLVRPDGSTVIVPAAEAERLRTLNLREETPREEMERGISRGIEKHYTTPLQKVQTIGSGLASGITFGLTDLGANDEDRERARYNPGYRIGSELLGGLVSMHPGLPGGLLSKAAQKAAGATGLGKAGQAAVRGGIEGAAYGGGAALTTAEMAGDPVTAEAIGAGIGWGTLFGGGLGLLGGAIEGKLENRAARKLKEQEARLAAVGAEEAGAFERSLGQARVQGVLAEGMKEQNLIRRGLEETHYANFASTVHDAANSLKVANEVVEEATKLNFSALKMSKNAISSQLVENYMIKEVRAEARAFEKYFTLAQAAAKKGNYNTVVHYLNKFNENMLVIEQKLGGSKFFNSEKVVGQAEQLVGVAKERLASSVRAAEEVTNMTSIQGALKSFPKTAEEFIAMKPDRVEKLTAAIDSLGKMKAAELEGVQAAVKDSVAKMAEGLGIKMEGTPGAQMQGMWKALKMGTGKRAAEELRMAREANLLWGKTGQAQETLEQARMRGTAELTGVSKKRGGMHSMETFMRYNVGKAFAQKMGTPGYIMGAGLVTGLMGLKGAILGTIVEKVEKWAPKAARGLQTVGPRLEPLARRIDGVPDEDKSRQELMAARSREILEAAPGVRDTMYKALEPLVREHPELAATLHQQQIARFQFLLGKLPKDPGLAYSNLKSLWKPDNVAVEKFARYYEVFHDPMGVMTKALESGKITLEAAEGLREMNPELWQTLRVRMLERISEPEVAKKMSYADQVHVGMLLGLNLHSTMDPRFISAQQQMYTERNQPLEMNPRIQPGGGAGRPSGPGPSATAGQKVTEH
jgi:hypothetical protein